MNELKIHNISHTDVAKEAKVSVRAVGRCLNNEFDSMKIYLACMRMIQISISKQTALVLKYQGTLCKFLEMEKTDSENV